MADRLDQLAHQFAASGAVRFAVGGDHPLVDASGGFDLDVVVGREQCGQAVLLLLGEQVDAGVQGPASPVERVVLAAPVFDTRVIHHRMVGNGKPGAMEGYVAFVARVERRVGDEGKVVITLGDPLLDD